MERLASSSDLAEVLTLVNDSMRDCLSAERASVFRYDPKTHELFAEQAHGVSGPLRFSADMGIAGEAVRSRAIINVPDCYADRRFSTEVDRRTGYRTRCMLTIPLMSLDGRLEGVAQVLNKVPLKHAPSDGEPTGGGRELGTNGEAEAGSFTPEDETIARALASQAAVAIRRAALLDAERRKNKMEADLRVARDIQAATLPSSLPVVPGYSLAAWLTPAEETAGDAYDVITDAPEAGGGPASGSKLWFLVADAAGHGVGPALAVSQIQAMFRMGLRSGLGFMAILKHLNTAVCERLPVGVFVSAFMAELDARTHEMSYAAAGCSPVLVLRSGVGGVGGGVESLVSTLPPLGVDGELDESGIERLILRPGDAMVVATDGIFEQPSPTGKRLGASAYYDALLEGLGAGGPSPAAQRLLDATVDRAAAHRQSAVQADDQTIVVVARDRA